MNKTYRIVWNAAIGLFQVVSEFAKSGGKSKSNKALKLGALLVSGALASPAAMAGLPTGGTVVGGNGNISQNGSTMTINQSSNKMAINWQDFSIGQGKTVQFNQPSANAAALNRVLGPNVSVIQGALRANGQVFLVNPNGVLFSPTAQVDVGSIVASTLNISTDDFMAGRYNFSGDSAGKIVNQGSINAAEGGTVALIAAKIINEGSITAHRGNVLLGSGSKVTLDLGGPATLEVEEGALEALIENGGAIRADAGNILLTAYAAETLTSTVINTTGLIEARSLDIGEDGIVTLLGEQGNVQVAGTIDVSSDVAKGGKAVVTGDEVNINTGANIDATGATGGGEIYVGGGWQGKDPAIKQATKTTIQEGAVMDASATVKGDGGTVVAWSDITKADSITRVDGDLKAKGGAEGGDGGRIETSGAKLAVSKGADASAQNGKGGKWLLDPDTVNVTSGADTGGLVDGKMPSSTGEPHVVRHGALDAALENGTDVEIQAGRYITWHDDYSVDVHVNGAELKLSVDGTDIDTGEGIYLQGNITAGKDGGKLDIVMDGNVYLGRDANIELNSNGGDVLFGAYVDSRIDATVEQAGTLKITAGNGEVTFSDMVGGTNALDALYVTTTADGKTYINGSVVRTHNEQVYDSPVELGTVNFENSGFEEGLAGWTVTDGRFITGQTTVDGHTSPVDETYPNENANQRDETALSGTYLFKHGLVVGTEVDADGNHHASGNALSMSGSGNCATGYCVVRGGYVVSDSTIALAKGETVSFDWSAAAGGDAYDVFGYLLNVKTGEAQVILNDTGTTANEAIPWDTATVTADKAGVYKFVFVSGSYDLTGGKFLGADLRIDNVAASSGPKAVEGSSITFKQGIDTTDNDFTFKVDEIELGGTVEGTGKIAFETLAEGHGISVGGDQYQGNNPPVLHLSNGTLNALADGFESVRIGDDGMTGDISIDAPTVIKDDLLINAGTGNIDINAELEVKNDSPSSDPAPVIVLKTTKDDANNPDGGNVRQTDEGVIKAAGLAMLGDGATYKLDDADNQVDVIASETGSVTFGGDTVEVGVVTTKAGDSYEGMNNETDTTLIADNLNITKDIKTKNPAVGELTIKQKTPGRDIVLGGFNPNPMLGDSLDLTQPQLDKIGTFKKVNVGDEEAGVVSVHTDGATLTNNDLAVKTGDEFYVGGHLNVGDKTLSVEAPKGSQDDRRGKITAGQLALKGEGDFDLGDGKNPHAVGVIAADVGSLNFYNGSTPLEVGTIGDIEGITSLDGINLQTTGDLSIEEQVSSGGPISIKTGGDLAIGEGITSKDGDGEKDIITLEVAGKATQDTDGVLNAAGLALLGNDYDLTNPANSVNIIASDAGKVAFANEGDLTVGVLEATLADGSKQTVTGVDNTGDVSITTDANLEIQEKLITDGNVFLHVDGTATQDAETGQIEAAGLGLTGGNFELANLSNLVGNFASEAGDVHFVNSDDLTVGVLTEKKADGTDKQTLTGVNNTGELELITTEGDIELTEDVHTASTSKNAIVMNAGRDAAAGDIDGGNVKHAAGEVSTGEGGRTVIYTGGLEESTGLVDVVGEGSGNFRYNSDEEQSNFGKALGNSGIYAVYREQPTLLVSTNANTTTRKVYDGKADFDGGGFAGYDVDVSGLFNGDTKAMLGNPEYWVESPAPGEYLITIAGLKALGYAIESDPNNANLTIVPAVDYEAARHSLALDNEYSVDRSNTHLPTPGLLGEQEAALQSQGTVNGGLLFVEQAEGAAEQGVPATTAQAAQHAQGADQAQGVTDARAEQALVAEAAGEQGESADEVDGTHCADGGVSGEGQCAAYPPQTVFVVRGGVRVPVQANL